MLNAARGLWLRMTKTPDQIDKMITEEAFHVILATQGRDTPADLKALQKVVAATRSAEEVERAAQDLAIGVVYVTAEQVRALAIPLYKLNARSSESHVAWACASTARWLRAVGLAVDWEVDS